MLVVAQYLTKVYLRSQEKIFALRGVDLQIEEGSFLFIVGPSGGGKSTLLHLLGGMDRPTSGQLFFNGFSLDKASEDQLTYFRRENIGFIFQFYNLLSSLSALDNISLPLLAKGCRLKEAHHQAADLLEQVGLASRMRHKPGQLSGGEQQRVAIARAVIGQPAMVIADEPTGDLDSTNAAAVLQLMLDLNQRLRITFVVATHNEALTPIGDRVLELHNGELRER